MGCGLGIKIFKRPSGDSTLVTTIQHTNERLDSTYDTIIKKTMPEADEPSLAWHLIECRYRYVDL